MLIVAGISVAAEADTSPEAQARGARSAVASSLTHAFPIVKRRFHHPPSWASLVEYPIIGDPNIDTEIGGFATDCYTAGEFSIDAGRCTRMVTAKIIRREYLVIKFESFDIAGGQPHGEDTWFYRTYRRAGGRWVGISNSFVSKNDDCVERIAKVLEQHVRRQLADPQREELRGAESVLEAATQKLTDRGVTFEFEQYAFNSYTPPTPVEISSKDLGACFQPQIASVGSQ